MLKKFVKENIDIICLLLLSLCSCCLYVVNSYFALIIFSLSVILVVLKSGRNIFRRFIICFVCCFILYALLYRFYGDRLDILMSFSIFISLYFAYFGEFVVGAKGLVLFVFSIFLILFSWSFEYSYLWSFVLGAILSSVSFLVLVNIKKK